MITDKYEYTSTEDNEYFEFISIGPKGTIIKAVQFVLIDPENQVYSLGLGDRDPISDEVKDDITSDNKDTEKIFSTIGYICTVFLDNKPSAIIFIEGNTTSRNRIYRMGINKNLTLLASQYEIYGLKEQNHLWERFIKSSDYIAFTVSKIH